MKEDSQILESVADRVLSILKPLLASENPPIRTVVEQLRVLHAPPDVLAATINTVTKLVSTHPPPSNQQSLPSQRHLCGLVSVLMSSRILSREILYSALDSDAASLFVDAETWRSDHLRTRTRMWYTQTRFNLFREETEGYAKALSHLWKSSFSSAEPSTVFEILVSYIGQYSLDTNRVIEIVLSVAAERVLESISKTSGRPIAHRIPQPFAHILDRFPPNHVCSVIGAMLRAYHDSAITDTEVGAEAHFTETDSKFEAKASQALVSLVSVMVSEGKLQVADILGYLSPIDNTEFKTRFAHYERDVGALVESVNGSRMGAHRTGDDLKSTRSFHGTTDRDVFLRYKLLEKGPLDSFSTHSQKINFILTLIGLCRSRDAVTAIFGLSIDGEHIDVAACPTITKAFIGIIEALLSPLLHAQFPSLYTENKVLTNAIRQLGGKEKGYDVPIETIEEFLSDDVDGPGIVIRQLLLILGPYARTSIRLLQALCRVFQGRTEKHVVSIMKEVVLPATSLVQSNVALADDVWNVLKHWHHPTRWDLYGHVLRVVSVTNAEYQVVSGRASYETRYVLKRLTADNQKQHTLTIAKITHGQAIASFSAALDRIQGYPADVVTISPVIEACRRCTYLSIDILLYLVLNRMADSRRSRLKEDGINTAQWYATLSLFLGLCLRKLSIEPEHVDAVLYFLHSKLVEDDEPLMIAALSDIIKCVADIEVDINLSLKQIRSYGGGCVLREAVSGLWSKVQPDAQVSGTALDLRTEKERSSATCMLLEAFERTKVYPYVAVAIARLTRDAVRHESIRTMPLKLGGNIVDMARTSLLQLSQFMGTRLCDSRRNKECRQRISKIIYNVGLGNMVQAMRVPVSSAIALIAPELDCVKELEAEFMNDSKRELHLVEPSNDTNRASESTSEKHAACTDDNKDFNMEKVCGVDSDTANEENKDLQTGTHLAEFLHRRAGGSISKFLVTFFWYAKLNDISYPQDMYETEQKRFLSIKGSWEKEIDASRLRGQLDTDRLRRLNYELSRIQEYMEELSAERKSLANRLIHVVGTLKRRKDEIVAGAKMSSCSEGRKETYFFIQDCVLPRCKVSRPDALFCSRFVQLLLEQKIPAICFRGYYEILLQLTPVIIRSCSENESLCFAYLIKETLVTLDGWRSNRSKYEEQAASTNGFQIMEPADKAGPMKHWQYCRWLYDIHESLVNGLSSVLNSGEYLYSRNSLSLLNAVAEVFPKVSEHCSKIELSVEKLTKSDLADVRLTSTGVLARLRAGKARRLPIHVFTLRPFLGGEGLQRGNASRTGAPVAPIRTETVGESDTGTRPAVKSFERDAQENIPDGKETLSAKVSPRPNQQGSSHTQPLGQGQSGSEKPTAGGQAKPKQATSAAGFSSNGAMDASTSEGPRTEIVQRRLDPSAREFVPVSETETGTQSGKRSRPSDGDSSDSVRHPMRNDIGGSVGQPSKDRPPPLKKARSEGKGKRDNREGESSIGEKPKDKAPKEPGQAHAQLSAGENNKLKSTTQSDEKFATSGGPGGSQNGGTGRVVRGERANSPGRRNTGFRQPFDSGKEYGNNKLGAGDRYRDNSRLRNIRRDNATSNVNHGRDTARDTAGRDHGPGRRRDAYDHSASGDRRTGLPAGDFRRSASESKLGEGSGGNDFTHGRDYQGDGQGTKRRRELPPSRGPYVYESDGRRQPRPRKEGDYDRFHDDGKNGSDRRFNSNSPGRENGGTSNPNWMGGRRHGDVHEVSRRQGDVHEGSRRQGDVHEGPRRQGDEDQIGWQKRAERDFDGGPRGMRRDDRDMYFDRQERYGEGPGRRDDRRRPLLRGRPARRRTGRG